MSYQDENESGKHRQERTVEGNSEEQKEFAWWPRQDIDGYELVVGGYRAQVKAKGGFWISGPNGGTVGVAEPATVAQAKIIVEAWLRAQGVEP